MSLKKVIAATLLTSVVIGGGFSTTLQPAHAVQKKAGETIKVKVKGLFCDLCRTKMEKSFGRVAGVNKVDVNLESGFVTIWMAKGKTLGDQRVNKIVRETGYTPVSINRS